jgi:hypothetical protein
MQFWYFLIAISCAGLLCAGLTFVAVDWLLRTLFARALGGTHEVPDAISFVLSFVAAFGVLGVTVVNLFFVGVGP